MSALEGIREGLLAIHPQSPAPGSAAVRQFREALTLVFGGRTHDLA
jgi:hypothetical protein